MEFKSIKKFNLTETEKGFFSKIYLSNGILRLDLLNEKRLKTATFYNTIESLIQKNLIYTTRVEKPKNIGRPPEALWVNSNYTYVLGIFLTSFEYRTAILNFCGDILCERKFYLQKNTSILDFINNCHASYLEMVKELSLSDSDVCGIAVSTIGPIDYKSGIILHLKYTGGKTWDNFKIVQVLEEQFHKKVVIQGIANSCAYGLYFLNYAKEYTDLAFFMINRGISSGIILGSKPFRNENIMPLDMNHMIIRAGGTCCDCGHYGCLITQVGANYVHNFAIEQLKFGKKTSIPYQSVDDITFEDICIYADQGDSFCAGIVEDAALSFTIGLNNFLRIIDLPLIVLGGIFIENSNLFFQTVNREIASYFPNVKIEKNTNYVIHAYRGAAAKLVFSLIKR